MNNEERLQHYNKRLSRFITELEFQFGVFGLSRNEAIKLENARRQLDPKRFRCFIEDLKLDKYKNKVDT